MEGHCLLFFVVFNKLISTCTYGKSLDPSWINDKSIQISQVCTFAAPLLSTPLQPTGCNEFTVRMAVSD
uniref:Uncharacterized protein n=1 Tax=Rhodnius prolixus TaxID=13249 RepID=T1HYF8_RHOPR